jgi:hypothetical protein
MSEKCLVYRVNDAEAVQGPAPFAERAGYVVTPPAELPAARPELESWALEFPWALVAGANQ